jgi:hypothetical protein
LAKLKEIFRQNISQPVERVIEQINAILRGWVNYFAIGDSSECFSFVRDWVEKQVQEHLTRARERTGFGFDHALHNARLIDAIRRAAERGERQKSIQPTRKHVPPDLGFDCRYHGNALIEEPLVRVPF